MAFLFLHFSVHMSLPELGMSRILRLHTHFKRNDTVTRDQKTSIPHGSITQSFIAHRALTDAGPNLCVEGESRGLNSLQGVESFLRS